MLPLIIWWGGQTARECEGEKAVKLPERMKMLRLREGLRQEDAAKELDISMSAYCRYEYGKREPTASVLWRMADFYNVTIIIWWGGAMPERIPQAERKEVPYGRILRPNPNCRGGVCGEAVPVYRQYLAR